MLYGFVRKADDFVDASPQDVQGFYVFKNAYLKAKEGKQSGDFIVDSFMRLCEKYDFDLQWVEAFLHSMELDLTKNEYNSLSEILEYIYGSAEVIGLFMASIMELPKESYYHAQMQGRAMQYINFIRDIKEDLSFGRRYLPLENTPLKSLEFDYVLGHEDEFRAFHRMQIEFYENWQSEAEKGYSFIPRKYLIPVKTAAAMYLWSANQIKKNPMIVYERKVKPAKWRILLEFIKHFIGL